MSDNMYTPPETVAAAASSRNGGAVTAEAREALAKTAFWYKFFGILGFIGCSVMILGVLIAMTAAGAVAEQFVLSFIMAEMGAFVGIICIAMGVVIFLPARSLYKAGKAGERYQFTDSPDDLTVSLEYTRKYWMFIGIIVIVQLALLPIIPVVEVIAGAAGL